MTSCQNHDQGPSCNEEIEPITSEDVDRVLGLGDQFLEDWEDDDGKDAESTAECLERRREWDNMRPLIVAAPDLRNALQALRDEVMRDCETSSASADLFAAALAGADAALLKSKGAL